MAELAVIMSMITVTSTAAGILGIIKRRCGASRTITELASKCTELVDKISNLLKTMEDGAQVPSNTRGISTALNHRREEFDAILKDLEKMKRRTKRTHPVDRTEKFILSQGWAKKMEALYNDLDRLRNGIENLVSNWDVAQIVVTKVEEIATIDVTTKESGRQEGIVKHYAETEMRNRGSVSVDQILTTMVKLNDANKAALNRLGNLSELSLPNALFEASGYASDDVCYLQLLQSSAELHHPGANSILGNCYRDGFMVVKNVDAAMSYYRVASSHGNFHSTIELMQYYHHKKDRRSSMKYFVKACIALHGISPIGLNACSMRFCTVLKPLNSRSLSLVGTQNMMQSGKVFAIFSGLEHLEIVRKLLTRYKKLILALILQK